MQDRVKNILAQMTLLEKCSLLSGMDFWHTQTVERVGLPAIMVSDGPHGLRRQASEGDHLGLNESVPATCFPTGVGLGSSWDRNLIFQVGALIGEEAQAQGVSVVLGPGLQYQTITFMWPQFRIFVRGSLPFHADGQTSYSGGTEPGSRNLYQTFLRQQSGT